MKSKLAVLSSLTCLAGGFVLLPSAQSQPQLGPCSQYIGKTCPSTASEYRQCLQEDGLPDYVMCYQGWWIWA